MEYFLCDAFGNEMITLLSFPVKMWGEGTNKFLGLSDTPVATGVSACGI